MNRILVVAPSWIGDTVLAQSLFATLKARKPTPRVEVLAPEWSLPLLERMPQVDEALPAPFAHGRFMAGARLALARRLRRRAYAQAIVLPNSWKSALVPFLAGIPLRTGWLGEQRFGLLNDWRRLDRRALPSTVQRFVALGLPAGATPAEEIPRPLLTIRAEQVESTLRELGLPGPRGRLLAFCPGAEYGPAKRWPVEYFAAVARAWTARGGAVWIFGSPRDAPVSAEINALANGACEDLAGRTSLSQVIDLLSLADAVVTNDTGLMHVAAALDRRVIALYGSSDPAMTPPLSDRATVLHTGIECSPCFERECPFGHLRCLRELGPERVLNALEQSVRSSRLES